MKKNAGKIVRLLVIAAMTAVIIGALGVTTSAYKYTVTRYIGVEYGLPRKIGPEDYGNTYSFSDPSMVLINGKEITKYSGIKSTDTVEYIKTGELQMNHMWYYRDNSGSYSDSDTYIITVKEKEAFRGDIKVTYDEPFVAGKPFPELKVESEGNGARFLRAWFEITGAGTHDDEVIPDYYAGVEAEIEVELRPTEGYYFGWVDDGEPYWSPALSNVTVNGKKVDASVFTYKKGNTLHFSFPVTIGAEVKEINITDLDVPTHGTTLDRTATASVGTVTAVKYEMFRKEINEVSKGDNISVGVLVKLPEGYTFADGSYAVWNGQTSEYRIRTSSMGTDEYLYVFPVTVDVFSEQAYINSGSVYFTGDAMLEVGSRIPDRDYIGSDDNGIIYGDPIWTPADKTFKSGTTYTVKIPMELEPGYIWTDDIKTNNSFSIESKEAVLVIEGETTGGKQKFDTKKYITATFTPEDIEGQTEEKTDGKTDGKTEEKYFDLEVTYSKTNFNLEVGDKATVTAMTNIDNKLAKDLKIQWYSTTSKTYGTGVAVKGADSLTLTIPTDKTGTKYYYCEVSCEMMGEKSNLIQKSDIVKVTVSKAAAKNETPFNDISATDPYYESVKYVYEHNPQLMNGVSADSFDPQGNLTRAAIVTVLYRLEGSPAVNPSNDFNDVKSGEWYADAVAWAVSKGITNGYGDGRFGPNDPITREQLAVFLYRYAKSRNFVVPAYATFKQPDASEIDSWALDAMKWAFSKGIIEEIGGMLNPLDYAKRHMIATALMQFCVSYSM